MSSLTVIVPVYNSRATLKACLASIRVSLGVSFDLIVIDDGSTDGSADIARRYADKLICLDKNLGRLNARNMGMDAARGDVLVFIDSDVCIKPGSLLMIDEFFRDHPDIAAVTGALSTGNMGQGFFSEYKNLYMHHTFKRMPGNVSFLYGSIFALRANIKHLSRFDREIAEDTSLGHTLVEYGHKISLLKELEVDHLKAYTALSFLVNDFRVPYHWARIFWMSGGWKKIYKKGPVFAHASKGQVLSLLLAVFTSIFIATPLSLTGFLLWFYLNVGFLIFLCRKRGIFFGVRGLVLTWVDHLVMFSGVVAGTVALLKPQILHKGTHE